MEFYIEKASKEDYQLFADVIQTVWEAMEHKEWYMADNAEYTRRMLDSGKGIGYKAVEEETGSVAGILLVTFPGTEESNLGLDIGLPEDALPLVAHMDSAAVLPRFRGNRLQRRLLQAAEEDLRAGGIRYLMCTIHPDNAPSLRTALGLGYRVMTTKEKYGGNLRAVLLKELSPQGDA